MGSDKEKDTIKIIKDVENFQSLKEDWQDVLENSGESSPFQTFEWQFEWWQRFGAGRNLFIVVIMIQNDLQAIAPLMITKKSGLRVLEFIGTGISDYLGFITGFDGEKNVRRILDFLVSECKEWDIANFSDVEAPKYIIDFVKGIGLKGFDRIYELSPYIGIEKSWDDFIRSKGKSSVKHFKYNISKIEKMGKVEVISIDAGKRGQEISNIIWDIERRSWKVSAGTAHFAKEDRRNFFAEILDKFSSRGWLDGYLLKIDGKFVAYSVGFKYGTKIYNYEVGYDERFPGAGNYLTSIHIRKAFEDGMKEYDFLRGDEPYKMRWTEKSREVYQLVFSQRNSLFMAAAVFSLFRLRWILGKSELVKKCHLKIKEIGARLHKRGGDGLVKEEKLTEGRERISE